MLYTIPDYYKQFHCIADKCEDTCCAGWKIVIDKKSLAKYKKIHGRFMWRMIRSVNWCSGTFCQDKEKRCAFLNENNLCDLYISQGEKSLCKTCRLYPRHIEEFEGVKEITLSVSCPEVARILMERKTPVTFLNYEKEKSEEEYEDFDLFLFSMLQDARAKMIEILQDRTLSISVRTLLIMGMAHDIQGRVNRQELFSCYNVIEKYSTEKAQHFALAFLKNETIAEKEMIVGKEMFQHLYELELLKEDWYVLLKETELLLYGDGKQHYKEIQDEFSYWASEHLEMEIHMEQLLVYFLFTYFLGAVYDGEVYPKAQMAVYCVWMIEKLWVARWIRNEKMLDLEEMIELVYRFSREVEHSDENLKQIEKFMEKKWI